MILGTGVDIAEVPRIRESIERFGDSLSSSAYSLTAKFIIASKERIVLKAMLPGLRQKKPE